MSQIHLLTGLENVIKSSYTVKLLVVNVDHKLRFDFHISKLCATAAMQLNSLSQLKGYIRKTEKQPEPTAFSLQTLIIAH